MDIHTLWWGAPHLGKPERTTTKEGYQRETLKEHKGGVEGNASHRNKAL